MKILFFVVCIMAALSFSALSFIIASGKIPFRSQMESAGSASAAKPKEWVPETFSVDHKAIDDLLQTLNKQKEDNDKKIEELAVKETVIAEQKKYIEEFELKIAGLQQKLNNKLIEIDSTEAVNTKKIADMYSKMEPVNASTLLQKEDPERAAKIIVLIPERQAAAIMNAAVSDTNNVALVSKWSDNIRKLKKPSKEK